MMPACHSAAGPQPAYLPAFLPTFEIHSRACQQRANDTLAKLEQCIQRSSLWHYLTHFQVIADENPGSKGHGNRNTGTTGYTASVAYVAKLMRAAGYNVHIQRYRYTKYDFVGTPEFRAGSRVYGIEREWFVARLSGSGVVTAPIEPPGGSSTGCLHRDFAGFARGKIALIERGDCDFDTQVANAEAAGARAAILYNQRPTPDESSNATLNDAYEARLVDPAKIPVAGVVAYAAGADLLRQYRSGAAPTAHLDIREQPKSDIDYNLIADSPFGNSRRVVVIEAHLDSIYGAGMLDNASGSTTILDIALNMAKTRTVNRLRYIWFGGEEIGLLGSRYYTKHLTQAQLNQIVFDIDADVTATPNFDIMIADPRYAAKVKLFPPNVVPQSKIGNDYFTDFFRAGGVVSRSAHFGNDGTDSLSFSLAGIPNSGILTRQDCCKRTWETKMWGGVRGNYEGQIPSFNGGCVDRPSRWCDNLYNNDPFVLELASKAVAYVTFKLANRPHFAR